VSGYFSQKDHSTHEFLASSLSILLSETFNHELIASFTYSSILSNSGLSTFLSKSKSNLNLSAVIFEPF
jgi:hypothetical protein